VVFPKGIVPEGDPDQVLISIIEAKRPGTDEEEAGETGEEPETTEKQAEE